MIIIRISFTVKKVIISILCFNFFDNQVDKRIKGIHESLRDNLLSLDNPVEARISSSILFGNIIRFAETQKWINDDIFRLFSQLMPFFLAKFPPLKLFLVEAVAFFVLFSFSCVKPCVWDNSPRRCKIMILMEEIVNAIIGITVLYLQWRRKRTSTWSDVKAVTYLLSSALYIGMT